MTNEAEKPGVRGFFKRLRAKLNTGPAWLTTDIKELLPGRKIDAEILDDLETRLKALHGAMCDILKPVEQPLTIDRSIKPYVILVVGINGAGKTTTIGK